MYETHDFLDFCLPDMVRMQRERPQVYTQFMSTMYKMIASNPAGRVVLDLWVTAKVILSCIPMSFVYCLLYIYMVSKMAYLIAWFILGTCQLALIVSSYACFWEYGNND